MNHRDPDASNAEIRPPDQTEERGETVEWDGSDVESVPNKAPGDDGASSFAAGTFSGWQNLGLPFTDWDRYEPRGPVGEGGMGRVVRAFDPRLEREVALKFLHDDDKRRVDRLLREAQTQARVHHPNVCTVHEVGEVHGQPYISMQLIEGHRFDQVSPRMTHTERVRVMVDVCEAVHAAHRAGLIHRDLKPDNIMVERDPDGRWIPYVLDFGIARTVGSAETSSSDRFAGTPAYLSPEQAGIIERPLSERTDVYSLGATLYQTLVGRPPFAAPNIGAMITAIADQRPPRPRSIDRSIPIDLEAVVSKSMSLNPEDRYTSAREMADDLRRFLEGDPIVAAEGGLGYRLGKRLSKNRLLTSVITAAVIVVFVLGTIAVWSFFRSREQAQIAQRMGIEISAVEQSMRQEILLPLHDISSERLRLTSRLERLETESEAFGRVGRGPALYALGRGYAGIFDNDRAHKYLEEAWSLGYRRPEVALALGEVLGRLYQAELEEISRITLPGAREKRRLRAEIELRDRALELLRRAESSNSEGVELAAAWIALYEHRWDDAITVTVAVADDGSRLSLDARTIEANAHLLRVRELRNRGEHEGIEAWLAAAGESIERAVDVARSDPMLHHLDCLRWISEMEVAAKKGDDLDTAFERARAAGERTLTADPQMSSAHRALSQAWFVLGEHQARFGTDPRPALAESVNAAEHAVAVDRDDFDAHVYAGLALWTLANINLRIGADPSPDLDRAEEHFSRAMASARVGMETAYVHLDLGLVYVLRGTMAERTGGDPDPHWGRAILEYRSGLEIEPDLPTGWLNLGNVFALQAEHANLHGGDSSTFIEEAIANFDRALDLEPGLFNAHSNLASALWSKTDLQRERGEDIEPTLRAGIENLRKALTLRPGYLAAHYNLGNLLWLLGDDQAGKGSDPSVYYAEARSSFNVLIGAAPRYEFVRPYVAGLHRSDAEFILAAGGDPEPSLRDADTVIDAALDADPSSAEAHAEHIEVTLIRAAQATGTGDDPSAFLMSAQAALDLVGEPAMVASQELLSAAAHLAWRRALSQRAAGGSFDESVDLGLEISRRALEMDVRSDRTRAIRGALHLLAAESAIDPESAERHRVQGELDLETALRRNPALVLSFGRSAAAHGAPGDRP